MDISEKIVLSLACVVAACLVACLVLGYQLETRKLDILESLAETCGQLEDYQ